MNLTKRTILSLSAVTMLGSGMAHAVYTPIVSSTGNNFTMVGLNNEFVGGNSTTAFTWDGTYRTAVVTDGSYNATISSATKFYGYNWTAHNVNIYAPGIYTFQTDCAAGNPSVGCVNKSPISQPAGLTYTLTVGAGQVGVHMLFDWGSSRTLSCGRNACDIDIVVLWDMNKSWAQTGTSSPLQTDAFTTIDTVWDGVSIDTNIDADNYSGTQMIDGTFMGYSINFSVNGIHAVPATAPVPVPAAAWLFFSGLLGLIGVARGKAA